MKIKKIVSQLRDQLGELQQKRVDLLNQGATNLEELEQRDAEFAREIAGLERGIKMLQSPKLAIDWLVERIKTMWLYHDEMLDCWSQGLNEAIRFSRGMGEEIKFLGQARQELLQQQEQQLKLDGQKLMQYVPELESVPEEPEQEEPQASAVCTVDGWIDSSENGPEVSLIVYAPSLSDGAF